MKLGRHQKFNGVDYECRLCERHFASRGSIYAHCRYTSQHEWCEKCRRVFVSERAKNDHLRYSRRHNICWNCPDRRDFETAKDLKNHLSECHHYCHPCHRAHNSARELQDHDVAVHHLCVKCGQYFQNENSLRMHQQTHLPRDMECFGCFQTFKSFSGMLIHLESGNCQSGTDKEKIDDLFCEWDQGWKYKLDDDEGEGLIFLCPECDKDFPRLSALYQHAEDVPRCSYLTEEGGCLDELRVFIERRI